MSDPYNKQNKQDFLYPVIKLMLQISKEEASETHRWVSFPKVYFCTLYGLNLVKKQGKTVGTYVLQTSAVDSNFCQIKPFKPLQGSYSSDSRDEKGCEDDSL